MENNFNKTIRFRSPINSETSYGSTSLSNDAESEIEISIDLNTGVGFFEWTVDELNVCESGGLWFDGQTLVDYDGVFSLPEQLITELENSGFDMEHAK